MLDSLIMFDVLDGREGWKIAKDLDRGEGIYGLLNKGISGLQLGVLSDTEREHCSCDILESYDVALDRLRSLGAKLVPFENPTSYDGLANDNGMITAVEAFYNHGQLYKNFDLPMDEDVRARMLVGEKFSAHEYFSTLQRRQIMIKEFVEFINAA